MRALRQFHFYLGCLFAPLIIYFALSGAWQVFRLNDLPKGETPSELRTVLHELSKPHKSSTLPGRDSKTERSVAFNGMALALAIGLIASAASGIVIAWSYARSRRLVLACVLTGILLPVCLLLLR